MKNRYLNSDPMEWLTDGADPAATYLAKKEFCEWYDPDLIYHELEESALTDYFKKLLKGNILGDIKNPDLIYRGTVWNFLLAVEYGYDSRTGFIRDTAAYIAENFSTPDGGFALSLKPRVPLSCRTGEIVRAMIKAGIKNNTTDSGLLWIAAHQRRDGGWLHCPFNGFCDIMKMLLLKKAGSGIDREENERFPSCPAATLSCIRALSLSEKNEYKPKIEEAALFLLSFFKSSPTDKQLYCGLNLQPQKCGYPVMTQFDSITALIEIFATGLWNHPACAVIFNNIIKRQTSAGTWKLENNSRGMITSGKGENRLVTLNVIRLLKRLDERET